MLARGRAGRGEERLAVRSARKRGVRTGCTGAGCDVAGGGLGRLRAQAAGGDRDGAADRRSQTPDGRKRRSVLRLDHRRRAALLRRQLPPGYFAREQESLAEALDAHTDLVAEFARLEGAEHVLDVGCGLAAPALRIARRCSCHVTGVNISREQVRQARELIADHGLSDRVVVLHGDARALAFADACFDAIVCLEAAGDICVTEADKTGLVAELFRVLRPGGHVGFSDLALRERVSEADRDLRAVLYHSAEELVTDWPAIFAGQGFRLLECRDIITETLPTWEHVRAVYQRRNEEVIRRYGRRLASRTIAHLERIASVLAVYGTFPVIAALKPW